MGERALGYFEVYENYYISEKNNVLSISKKKIQFFFQRRIMTGQKSLINTGNQVS